MSNLEQEKVSKKRKEKKELTPEQQKRKTIGGWIVNILSVIIIVFALVFAILTIIRVTNSNGVTAVAGKVYMNVLSDSMKPTFKTGDVIIANEFNGDVSTLKVGQVITFKQRINGYDSFNTHRIIKINGNFIITRGDNQTDEDGNIIDWHNYLDDQTGTIKETVPVDNVVAVWGDVEEVDGELVFKPGKMMKGAGLMSNWLHDPEQGRLRFFLVIVLPLILLFVAYAFVLIRNIILLLSGIAIGGLMSSFVGLIKYLADNELKLAEMTYWLLGDISGSTYNNIYVFAPIVVVFTTITIFLSWKLNIVSLGEKDERALGVNYKLTMLLLIISATALTAGAVSVSGTIGWIGLVVPNIVRLIVGSDNRKVIPISILTGASFMIIVDMIARSLAPNEIPLSIITGILGTPLFIISIFIRRRDIK